jgi:hypothetical protein
MKGHTEQFGRALGVGLLVLALAFIVRPAAAAATTDDYWGVSIEFPDGSSILTRTDTGEVTVYPDSSGNTTTSMAAEGSTGVSVGDPVVVANSTTSTTMDYTPPDAAPNGMAPEDSTTSCGSPCGTTDNSSDTSSQSGITPAYSTPDGFHLYGNNRVNWFIYDSAWVDNTLEHYYDGSWHVIGRVRTMFDEYLPGGGSRYWRMRLHSLYMGGPAYNFQYEYWCGVNVPNQSDWTCNTKEKNADGYDANYVAFDEWGDETHWWWYSFGSGEKNYRKFPMIETHVDWPGYEQAGQARIKMRGWDIKWYTNNPDPGYAQANSWLISPVTGTGY